MMFDLQKEHPAVCCQCGTWFCKIENFVKHSKDCEAFKEACILDPKLRRIYEELLLLKEGALC